MQYIQCMSKIKICEQKIKKNLNGYQWDEFLSQGITVCFYHYCNSVMRTSN